LACVTTLATGADVTDTPVVLTPAATRADEREEEEDRAATMLELLEEPMSTEYATDADVVALLATMSVTLLIVTLSDVTPLTLAMPLVKAARLSVAAVTPANDTVEDTMLVVAAVVAAVVAVVAAVVVAVVAPAVVSPTVVATPAVVVTSVESAAAVEASVDAAAVVVVQDPQAVKSEIWEHKVDGLSTTHLYVYTVLWLPIVPEHSQFVH